MPLRTAGYHHQNPHNPHPHTEDRGRSKSKDYTRSADCSRTRQDLLETIQESPDGASPNKRLLRSKSTNDSVALANRKRHPAAHSGRTHSEQLLYTAINQNHQFKSKLTKSMSQEGGGASGTPQLPPTSIQKNIPMVNQEVMLPAKRPEFRRWNSYDIPSTESKDLMKLDVFSRPAGGGPVAGKDSVSPLTVLQDNFDTKRPVVNNVVNMRTDNSFKSLSRENVNETGVVEDRAKKPNLYEKMKNLAQTGMSSLVSFPERETLQSSGKSHIQSELDEESDSEDDDGETWRGNSKENLPDSDTQYPIDQVHTTLGTREPEDPINFEDLLKEIDDFQGNFVNKQPNRGGTLRSQQRQLDYKELYDYDSNDNTATTFSYEWKIQNETISSQYNAIRLRFSSRHMGVLGFIDRYQAQNKPTGPHPHVSFDEVNAELNSVWEQEYSSLFKSSAPTTPTMDSSDTIEDQNIYEKGITNMANLAKSVKLGGI
ncbi:hypothetical protein Cantr_09579 [Candida viswanathii]|uniref:Uncharacterized protein n=1 Tax=Candida viswanathii TaxID=5486 RepID=A0A367YCB8_9ASCO|nr:hypothetical protein Cantr_09579 [Candida viswanathii]